MEDWKKTLVRVPRWHETPEGILVPTHVDRPVVTGNDDPLPPDLDIRRPDLIIASRPPSSLDQIRVFPDEERAGYTTSTPAQLAAMVSQLPFEPGMVALARLSAHTEHLHGDTHAQLKFAETVFGDAALLTNLRAFAKEVNYELEIFPPQHMTVLERLLVLHGRDVNLGEEDPTGDEQAVFNRAFFAAGTLAVDEDRLGPLDEKAGRDRWITYFIQNGAYNANGPPMESMIRHQILFGEVARSLEGHRDYCPIDEWFVEDYGLSVKEQYVLGFAVIASSKMLDEAAPLSGRCVLGDAFFTDLAERLGRDNTRILDLMTASREWYAERFREGEQTSSRAAWDRLPFDVRPLLRLHDDRYLLTTPRSMNNWAGDGFFHRALASAREHKQSNQFLRFYGALVEAYALRTLREVHPEPRPAGSGRVSGEQEYVTRKGRKLSPDIAVDSGLDLVLIEIVSGRFTVPTLVGGDIGKAAADLQRLVFEKLDQLGARVDELLAGDWVPDGVDLAGVERIWPVLITADFIQNDLLWDEIDERMPDGLRLPRVQPITLIDLPDLETLAALVENGHSLADLIRQKATGRYARMDLRRFVRETPGLTGPVRLASIEAHWEQSMRTVIDLFGFEVDEDLLTDPRLTG